MDIIRIIRRNGDSWNMLFTGELERLLPIDQRFARALHPGNIMWISADATLDRIAGIRWGDKEFFALDAARLVRPFKRDEGEDVIISECGLIVVLICVLLRHQRYGNKRPTIVRAGNLNVFSWLNKWRAKSGTGKYYLEGAGRFPRRNRHRNHTSLCAKWARHCGRLFCKMH